MGRLERKLDLGLIERVLAGTAGRRAEPSPIKRVKPHRPASSYRGARRNTMRTRRKAKKEAQPC